MAACRYVLRRGFIVLEKRFPSNVAARCAFSSLQKPTSLKELLQSRLGMSDTDISVVQRRDNRVLKSVSAMKAEEAIQLFKSFGVSHAQLRMLCLSIPQFLRYRAEENVRPKLQALKSLGFTGEALGNVLCGGPRILSNADLQGRLRRLELAIGGSSNLVTLMSRYPHILEYNVEQVEKQVKLLKESGMADEAFRHLLSNFPTILKGCPERFRRAIDYLKEIGIPANSKKFLQALEAAARSGGSFEERINALLAAGFSDSQITDIAAKQPALLWRSPETLQRKIGFYVNSAGLSIHNIVRSPALLQYSLEKRCKPRLALFEFLSASQPSVKLPSMQTFFRISETLLLNKYVTGNPNESKILQVMKVAW